MTEQLEAFVANVSSAGDSVEIPLELLSPMPVFKSARTDGEESGSDVYTDGVEVIQLISLETFQEQWGALHDMLGGYVGMRSGAPCPLGVQARSEQGFIACDAAFKLISSSPALSKMILSTKSSFIGNMMMLGLHGFNCVQIVKSSARHETLNPPQENED